MISFPCFQPRTPTRQRRLVRRRLAALLGVLSMAGVASAYAAEPPGRPPGGPGTVAVGTAAASAEQALYLVRSTLLSLDDANRSGNYTVLRDLSAPSFQQAHTAADLALIFSELRRSGIALTLIAITQPRLVADPVIDASNVLRLNGVLPTAHLQFVFDMRFQSVDGAWRLAALSGGARPLSAPPQSPPAQASPPQQAAPPIRVSQPQAAPRLAGGAGPDARPVRR